MDGDHIEIRGIDISVAADDVFGCLGTPGKAHPGLTNDVDRAIALGRSLWSPRGIYRRLSVEQVGGGGVTFTGGLYLEGKFLSHLFGGAEEAVFMVVTICPALEGRVAQLFEKGESVDAFILDAVGSASAMNLLVRALSDVCQQAEGRGWQAGSGISPGHSYWDVTGQRTIFQTLPAERIGVELLESSFLKPQKSQSAVVPLGPQLKVQADPSASFCRHCPASNCPLRKEPQTRV